MHLQDNTSQCVPSRLTLALETPSVTAVQCRLCIKLNKEHVKVVSCYIPCAWPVDAYYNKYILSWHTKLVIVSMQTYFSSPLTVSKTRVRVEGLAHQINTWYSSSITSLFTKWSFTCGCKMCTDTKKMDTNRPGLTHHNEAESAGNKARKQMLNRMDLTLLS